MDNKKMMWIASVSVCAVVTLAVVLFFAMPKGNNDYDLKKLQDLFGSNQTTWATTANPVGAELNTLAADSAKPDTKACNKKGLHHVKTTDIGANWFTGSSAYFDDAALNKDAKGATWMRMFKVEAVQGKANSARLWVNAGVNGTDATVSDIWNVLDNKAHATDNMVDGCTTCAWGAAPVANISNTMAGYSGFWGPRDGRTGTTNGSTSEFRFEAGVGIYKVTMDIVAITTGTETVTTHADYIARGTVLATKTVVFVIQAPAVVA
jgi:hypothetical protein